MLCSLFILSEDPSLLHTPLLSLDRSCVLCPPGCSLHCFFKLSVLVPIVLIMAQTGPPTTGLIIPSWYAMHVTIAVKQLACQMCQKYHRKNMRQCLGKGLSIPPLIQMHFSTVWKCVEV